MSPPPSGSRKAVSVRGPQAGGVRCRSTKCPGPPAAPTTRQGPPPQAHRATSSNGAEPPPTGDVDQALVDQVLVDEAEQETEVVTTRRDYGWCGSSVGWVGRRQMQPLEGGQTLVDPSEGDLDGAEAVVQSANVAPLAADNTRRRADERAPLKPRESVSLRIDPRVAARTRLRSRDVPGRNSRLPPLWSPATAGLDSRQRPGCRAERCTRPRRPARHPPDAISQSRRSGSWPCSTPSPRPALPSWRSGRGKRDIPDEGHDHPLRAVRRVSNAT